jgi:hypothetical protein
MIDRIKHAALFALYQTTVAFGIVLLPLAMALSKVGLTLPVHRAVESLGAALEDSSNTA